MSAVAKRTGGEELAGLWRWFSWQLECSLTRSVLAGHEMAASDNWTFPAAVDSTARWYKAGGKLFALNSELTSLHEGPTESSRRVCFWWILNPLLLVKIWRFLVAWKKTLILCMRLDEVLDPDPEFLLVVADWTLVIIVWQHTGPLPTLI